MHLEEHPSRPHQLLLACSLQFQKPL
uniref:Uncharacterized protein n=1 Tax=Arundo donax TaxID=35708 RepID=A0A0A9CC79_ARUDO